MPLTAQDVAEITRLLEESEFDELLIEHEGLKLTLRRSASRTAAAQLTPAEPMSAAAASAAAERTLAVPPARAHPVTTPDPSRVSIVSPLVGIFYRAPKPGAPAFVEVGSQVEEDTIVGIIEVMKLMNTVRAQARGTVVDILVQDGGTVEYGQVLLRVAPEAARG